MLDIAAIAGLVSKMNVNILKEEFQAFISGLKLFSEKFENEKNVSVKSIFKESYVIDVGNNAEKNDIMGKPKISGSYDINKESGAKNGNGLKRKDLRKNTILDFIKGHNYTSIKDIVPNITGCSEKTVQRELINLINEGKIKKIGERRWSKYSTV